jgi:hypothetical protein
MANFSNESTFQNLPISQQSADCCEDDRSISTKVDDVCSFVDGEQHRVIPGPNGLSTIPS